MKKLWILVLFFIFFQAMPGHSESLKKEDKRNIFHNVLYAPAALAKFIVIDIPSSISLLFRPTARKIKKYEDDLSSINWNKRYSAVQGLNFIRSKKAYSLLLESLTDNNVIVSLKAYDSLKNAKKDDIVPLLIDSLEAHDGWTRKLVLDLLARFNDPITIKPIVFLANDEDRQVRLSAILALEDISGESLLFQFFPVLNTSRPRENIINWWYRRGKIIENYLTEKQG
ncbi:HEAT repeat domain-containing protein [bacterium]|nr:HEAT repeat domain-containing protein [bacterium]